MLGIRSSLLASLGLFAAVSGCASAGVNAPATSRDAAGDVPLLASLQSPVLVDGAETRTIARGQPLLFRFSEPLAKASVESSRGGVEASIASDDPRTLRVNVNDPAPGEEFALRLTNLVGANGAAADDASLLLQAPPPVELVSVAGAPPAPRMALPASSGLRLEWTVPVSTVRYRFKGESFSWTGEPAREVRLPVRLGQGWIESLTIEDALSDSGGWLPASETIELITPAPLLVAGFWPDPEAANVDPNSRPVFTFSEPIANSAAAEQAISFEPAASGRFEWQAPNRVRFIPTEGFEPDSTITMSVDAGLSGVGGGTLPERLVTTFDTGKLKVIEVSLSQQRLTLYENDEAVWTAPVATGVRGADTPIGTYHVQYKVRQARFRGVNPNGSRYDIPDVHWVIAFYGDYTIHGAYWRSVFGRPGSNGCISLSDPNAKVVFDWADEGTLIVVRA